MAKRYFALLQDKDWLTEQYIEKQRTYQNIADEIGCTKFGVYHAIKRFGIQSRKHTSKFPQLNDKEWVRQKYEDERLSTKQIAELVGSTVGNVGSALVWAGIPLRNAQQGIAARWPDGRPSETHPNWKGGVTALNRRIRATKKYKEWRQKVFERDNFTCQKCGKHGGDLEADHIKEFATYPHLRFELSNGRTLCQDCHYERTYGYKRKAKNGR